QSQGFLETSDWFREVEAIWDRHRTQRAKKQKTSFLDWLDWQHKLTDQSLGWRYLVLYSASAKDANAVVVEQGTLDRPFLVESKAYWFGTNDPAEAHYLAAFLNANE